LFVYLREIKFVELYGRNHAAESIFDKMKKENNAKTFIKTTYFVNDRDLSAPLNSRLYTLR